ncbi:MAG: AzlD domain-containing protein [Bacteroidales bacterium]|nr:AzlD domain-containing protein [Bacteroidales bacterium]
MCSLANVAIAMLIMALTTYLIRVVPIGFVRRKLDNEWVQDFLYYIPFCVLSAMTFPDVLYSTTPAGATSPHFVSAAVATMVAIVLAWKDRGLVRVALVAVLTALIVELLLPIVF